MCPPISFVLPRIFAGAVYKSLHSIRAATRNHGYSV